MGFFGIIVGKLLMEEKRHSCFKLNCGINSEEPVMTSVVIQTSLSVGHILQKD